jgi:MFS family permease
MQSIFSLLAGIGILLIGSGLLGTVLALRAGVEGFGEAVIGLVMSAYFVGFFAGTFVCPPLIRRVGHIRAFAMFAAVASSAVILHALVVNPLMWLLLRVVTGACLVGLYTVIESWLNAQTPNDRRGQVFALYMAVTLVALAAGQGLVALNDPAAFTAFGIAAILLSLGLVPIAFTSLTQPQPVTTPRLGLRFLYENSPAAVAGAFGSGVVVGAFWGLAPVFAQQVGMDTAGVAAFMSATILGGAALQLPIGHLSDRGDRRRVLAWVGLCAALCALGTAAIVDAGTGWLLAATFLFGGLAFSVYPVSVAHLNDHLQPDQVLEGASGLLLVHGVGAAAGPAVGGLLIGLYGPLSLLFLYAAVLGTLAAFELLRIGRSPAVAEAEQVPFTPMVRTSPEALVMLADAAEESQGDSAGKT